MKFPSSIVLLTQLISLRIVLANPSPQIDEPDLYCIPDSCFIYGNAVNKCAEINNIDTPHFENAAQDDLRAYEACYCDLTDLFKKCNDCFGNRTEAAEQRTMSEELCSLNRGTNTTTGNGNNTSTGNGNNTSTGGDSDDDTDDESDEPETDNKQNNAGALYLGKSMIAGLMIVAGGVIAVM